MPAPTLTTDPACRANPPLAGAGDWVRCQALPTEGLASGITLMQAHFVRHSFERHSHDTYSVGFTQSGVQAFRCRGGKHASQRGDLILFNPDEPHDGHPGTEAGFGYTILHIEPALAQRWLDPAAGTAAARHFKSPLVHDPVAAAALARAADALSQPQESLRAEALVAHAMAGLLARHGERPVALRAAQGASHAALQRVKDCIDARFAEDLSVDALAQLAGLSRMHFTRAFTRSFGLPPHAYLNNRRVRQAQRLLRQGLPLAEVAVAAGFADQSHLNRRFRGSVGLPPGAWLQQMAGTARRPNP